MEKLFNEKYGLVIVRGHHRYYSFDLTNKDQDINQITPRILTLPDNKEIKESSWGRMIVHTAKYLYKTYPMEDEKLLSLTLDGEHVFYYGSERFALYEVNNSGLYVTSSLAINDPVKLLIKIIEFYGFDVAKCKFLVKKMPIIEPEEVTAYVKEEMVKKFRYYLFHNQHIEDPMEIGKIIKRIERMNDFMKECNFPYNDFYGFDSFRFADSYFAKYLDKFNESRYGSNPKNVMIAKKYLEILRGFYKELGY